MTLITTSAGRDELSWSIFRLTVLLIPFPFYVTASPPFVATGGIWAPQTAIPVSLLILPFAVLGALHVWQLSTRMWLLVGSYSLMVALTVAALPFSQAQSQTLLFGFVWCLPVLWLFAAGNIVRSLNLKELAKLFLWGSIAGSFYIFLPGVIEILWTGGLGDGGRMTQNFLIPGQYQIAVYAASTLAFSLLLNIALRSLTREVLSDPLFIGYVLMTFVAVYFTGSREALIVAIVGPILIWAVRTPIRFLGLTAFGLLGLIALPLLADTLIDLLRSTSSRMSWKMALLIENPAAVIGDRTSVWMTHLQLAMLDPEIGTAVTPVQIAFPNHAELWTNPHGRPWASAHNFYVDALVQYGVVGAAIVWTFWAAVVAFAGLEIVAAWRTRQPTIYTSAAAIVLLIALFANMVNVPFRQPITIAVFCLTLAFLMSSPTLWVKQLLRGRDAEEIDHRAISAS